MDQILLEPKVRVQDVQTLADMMATLSYANGLTVDYEYTLPQDESDLRLAAQVGHLRNLSDPWIVDRLTRGMDQLVYDLRVALHRQGRLLRDAVRVRTDNDTDYTNLAPYLEDYYWLGRCADQLVLMTVDYHWDSGDPGPIAPLGWMRG